MFRAIGLKFQVLVLDKNPSLFKIFSLYYQSHRTLFSFSLLAIIAKYSFLLRKMAFAVSSKMAFAISSIVGVSMNKIALWIGVRENDWTAECAIIASNDSVAYYRNKVSSWVKIRSITIFILAQDGSALWWRPRTGALRNLWYQLQQQWKISRSLLQGTNFTVGRAANKC